MPELLERWVTTATGWPPVLLGPLDGDPVLTRSWRRPARLCRDATRCEQRSRYASGTSASLLTAGGEVVTAARIHREAIVAADSVLLVLGAREIHLQAGLAQLDLLLERA